MVKTHYVKIVSLVLTMAFCQTLFGEVECCLAQPELDVIKTRAPRAPVPPAQPVEQMTLYSTVGAVVPDPLTVNELIVADRADFSTAAVVLPTGSEAPTLVPSDGQIILVNGILYSYDAERAKWLSTSRQTVWADRSGVVSNTYLYLSNAVSTRTTGYEMLRDATITGMTVASGGNAWLVASVGGDFTTLQAALASPLVVNGDVITLAPETFTLPAFSSPIVVNKSVSIIGCDGATIQTAGTANDPTTVLSITTGNVFVHNVAIKQRKTTNSYIESAIGIAASTATGIVLDKLAVTTMYLGVTIDAAEFTVQNCDFRYEGPLGSSNFLIIVYRNNGVSRILNNRIYPSLDAPPSPAKTIFCYLTGSFYAGTLIITGNNQVATLQETYLKQFYIQDSFAGPSGAFELAVTGNTYNDENGGIVLYGGANILNLFSSIVVAGNNAANISGKGLITLDGYVTAVNPGATTWYIADNFLEYPGVFAPGFANATTTPGLIGYNTSVFIPPSITYSTTIPPLPAPTSPLFVLQARKCGFPAALASLLVMASRGFSTDLNVDLSVGDTLQMYVQSSATNPTAGIEYAYRLTTESN